MFRICALTFLIFASNAVITLFFPLYFQHRGMSMGEIGLIMGIGAFVTVVVPPVWGIVSDKTRAVTRLLLPLLCAGMLLTAPVFLLRLPAAIVISMVVFMCFVSAGPPLTESFLVKYTNSRGLQYGRIRLWGEAGVGIVALGLGVALEQFGVSYLGVLYAITLGACILTLVTIPDVASAPVPLTGQSLIRLVSDRTFLMYLGAVILYAIPHRMNDGFLTLYVRELGGSESDAGLAWLAATLSSVISLFAAGKLIGNRNELAVMVLAGICYCGRWLIYSLAEGPGMLIAAQTLHMLTFSLMLMTSTRYISRTVPRELTATALTLYSACFMGAGGIIGNMAGGWLMETFSMHAAYRTAMFVSFAGVLVTVVLYRLTRRRLAPSAQLS